MWHWNISKCPNQLNFVKKTKFDLYISWDFGICVCVCVCAVVCVRLCLDKDGSMWHSSNILGACPFIKSLSFLTKFGTKQ